MLVTNYGSLANSDVVAALSKANEEPQRWTVYLVHENGSQRSDAQNRLFRSLVRKLAQQVGKDVSYWTDFLVEKFLGHQEVQTEDGYTRRVLVSTSELTVDEFSSFLNACLVFASDIQVN